MSPSQSSARERAAARRQVILDDLRRHPLSTSREISERIQSETGGGPSLLTGSLYIAPWTVYADLRALEKAGKVGGWRDSSHRSIGWQALDA